MKIMLHAVDCRDSNDQSGKNWSCVYEGLGEEGYERVMKMMKAFPESLINNYAGIPGCRNKEVHFEYFAEENEINFRWRMTKEEFLRLMYPHDTSNNYCGSVHFGDCKLEFVFDQCEHNKFISFNNLYVYGKDDGYANLEDGTPYSYEDDMFALPKDDDFDKWKAECEKLIIKSLNNDKNYLLRYAIQKTKVDEWYPKKAWFGCLEDVCRDVARMMIRDGKKAFSFCESNQLEWDSYSPKEYDEKFGAEWFGIKRIDPVFDNSEDEYIVAIGYYGGGYVKTAYVQTDKHCIETNISDLARQMCNIIKSITDSYEQSVVFATEEKEDK